MKEKDEHGERTKIAKELSIYVEKGELVPDELVFPIFKEQMQAKEVEEKGWVLDGYPRSKNHFNFMKEIEVFPDYVFVLEINDDLSLQRQTGKVKDEKGRLFHLKFLPPPSHVKVEHSDIDKNLESAKKRLEIYRIEEEAFKTWFPNAIIIDGSLSPTEVFQKIEQILDNALKKK